MDLRLLISLCLFPFLLCTCTHDLSGPKSRSPENASVEDASARGKASEATPAPALSRGDLFKNGTLSLHNSLRFGIQENLNIRVAESATKSVAAGVDIARAEFDPVIYAFGGREYQIDGAEFEEIEGGIQKRFLTGTVVSVEGAYSSDTFVDSTFNSRFPNGFTSAQPGGLSAGSQLDSFVESLSDEDLTLRIRQPLLRGASLRANRAEIDLAKLTVDASNTAVRAEILEFLRGAETAYWTAAVAREIYLHEDQSLERNRRIVDDAKQRLDVGTASVLDLLEAEAGHAAAQETTIQARRRYEDAVDNFWFILGVPLDGQGHDLQFENIDEHVPAGRKPDPDKSYQLALDSYPSVILLANTIRQNQVRLGLAKNNLLPSVDLEVTSRWRSKNDFLPEEIERDYDWGVLLQLSIPWTFRAERAEVRRAQANLATSEIARENAKRALKKDILATCRAIEVSRKQLEVAIQAASINEKKWEEQQLRFREGLVSVRDLIEDQEQTKSAQTRELEARLRVIAAWKLLEQLDGSILRRRGFTWF